jgi:cell division initiation protein
LLPQDEAAVRITPLDIRNHPFGKQLRGYDREEVDAFLTMVAEDFESLVREAEGLRKAVAKLEGRVEEFTSNESILQETLTTAHKLSEDLKQTAIREAEATIGQAEIRGEKILDAAHRRAAKLAADIREMKNLRCRLAAAVRSTVATHMSLLESLAEDPPDEPLLESTIASLARNPQERGRGKRD